jgi:hypothetical protein
MEEMHETHKKKKEKKRAKNKQARKMFSLQYCYAAKYNKCVTAVVKNERHKVNKPTYQCRLSEQKSKVLGHFDLVVCLA